MPHLIAIFGHLLKKIRVKISKKIQIFKQGNLDFWDNSTDKRAYFENIKNICFDELRNPYIPAGEGEGLLNLLIDGFYYPTGLLADSIMTVYNNEKNDSDLIHLVEFYERFLDSSGHFLKRGVIKVLDNCLHGNALLSLYEFTKEKKYHNAC